MTKMLSKLTEHHKLLEAVGLLILLAAWGLSWNSVQRWQSATEDFQHSIESFNDAADKETADLIVAYEGAVTRATAGLAIDYSQPDAVLLAAWRSAEVRHLALARLLSDFARTDTRIMLAIQAAQREHLDVGLQLEDINAKYKKARAVLLPLIDAEGSILNRFPTEAEFSVEQASQIREAISPFVSQRFDVVNQVALAISAEKVSASQWYQIAYCIGAFLVVAGKIMDWRNTRAQVRQLAQRSTGETNAPVFGEVIKLGSTEQRPDTVGNPGQPSASSGQPASPSAR